MTNEDTLRLAIPTGRMNEAVVRVLADAGIEITKTSRGYRPLVSVPWLEIKFLKPQNVVEMLHAGSRDVGFTGADWVEELDGDLVEILDTRLDPVRVVAAAPSLIATRLDDLVRPLLVASEYERITRDWLERRGLTARFVRSYGATEVFPPEDADVIVDNTASGSTLEANGLVVVDDILRSSTRLYASRVAMQDSRRRRRIEQLVLLVTSVLEGRDRLMLEVNVTADRLEEIVSSLPCMREPTVAALAHDAGFAVKAAVPRGDLPRLIPLLKERGGSDIVVSRLSQIVP